MKTILIIAIIWLAAIIIWFTGFWCGKRATEMKNGSSDPKEKSKK